MTLAEACVRSVDVSGFALSMPNTRVARAGDNAGAAGSVAAAVGMATDDVYAELLPEQKLELVRVLRAQYGGKLVHVGDGINDAPALAAADIGIAMGAIAL